MAGPREPAFWLVTMKRVLELARSFPGMVGQDLARVVRKRNRRVRTGIRF